MPEPIVTLVPRPHNRWTALVGGAEIGMLTYDSRDQVFSFARTIDAKANWYEIVESGMTSISDALSVATYCAGQR